MKYTRDIPDYYSIKVKALLYLESLDLSKKCIKIPVSQNIYHLGNLLYHWTEIKAKKNLIIKDLESKFKKHYQPNTFEIAKKLVKASKENKLDKQKLIKYSSPNYYQNYLSKYIYK